jgi:AraC-like DNA-binding protein
LGTYLPHHPAATLRDRQDVNLPGLTSRLFWLQGSTWEYPSYANAEALVSRLFRAGLLARDTAVAAALNGDSLALSRRSAQRHFQLATGMTHGTYRQIERARHAVDLLRRGVSIVETAHLAGYFDQAHLTRSLRRRVGQTPARLLRGEQQLSFLYKTNPPG